MADQQASSSSAEKIIEEANTSQAEPTTSSSNGESSSSSAPIASPKKCTQCSALETESKPLKPCSKCQTALYCSRDCQKGNFKIHKKTCAKDAQAYALKADLKPSAPPRPPKEGHRGGLQKWQFDT